MGRGAALARLIDNLLAGDRVTWTVVGVCLGPLALFGLFVLKVRRDLAREDADRGRR